MHTISSPKGLLLRPPPPIDDLYFCQAIRVMKMIQVLHGKGFHGLRLWSVLNGSFTVFYVFPACYTVVGGVHPNYELIEEKGDDRLIATHACGYGSSLFDWGEMKDVTLHDLAIKFINEFPSMANLARHLDYAYVGWFATLLGHCEYGFIPEVYFMEQPPLQSISLHRFGPYEMQDFPLPPSSAYGHSIT